MKSYKQARCELEQMPPGYLNLDARVSGTLLTWREILECHPTKGQTHKGPAKIVRGRFKDNSNIILRQGPDGKYDTISLRRCFISKVPDSKSSYKDTDEYKIKSKLLEVSNNPPILTTPAEDAEGWPPLSDEHVRYMVSDSVLTHTVYTKWLVEH